MRLLLLNLLTASATVVVLGVLTLPAIAVHDRLVRPPTLPVADTRAFGVYIDPWHIDDWAAGVGATPTIAAKFESFSRRRTIDNFTHEAERRGIGSVLLSLGPWRRRTAKLGLYRQSYPQRGYRNVDIAHGSQDGY